MNKPLIGVAPLVDEKKDSLWMLPGYLDAIESVGGIPIILPLSCEPSVLNPLLDLCDGFLLTGGHDVSPCCYGEEALPSCGVPAPQRDRQDGLILDGAIARHKPILGICRGLQLMNTHLGGTLYQDLPTQRPSAITHQMTAPYNRAVHQVNLVEGGFLHHLLGVDQLGVNSYHHQAIKVLAPCLVADAYSEDGLVEAIRLPDHPFACAIQWHPEFFYQDDPSCRLIMEAFVQASQSN